VRQTSARRSTIRRGRTITGNALTPVPVIPTVPTGEREVPCPVCGATLVKGVRVFWLHIGTTKSCPAYEPAALSWLKR